jgi:prolipoprotein diacylglyceryltransferase
MKHFINGLFVFIIVFLIYFAFMHKMDVIGSLVVVYLLFLCVFGLVVNKNCS